MKCLLTLALFLAGRIRARGTRFRQPACQRQACSAGEYRQFDFWIGDWDVTAGDQPAGTNSIHPINGGCALQENWQGAGQGGIVGTSFNIYDQATGRWHQTWVDSSGTLLQLDGGLIDGVMVLSGERPARDGNGMVMHRISWTPNPDGTVRQLWEASTERARAGMCCLMGSTRGYLRAMKRSKTGLIRLVDATQNSINGISACWKHEAAFRQDVMPCPRAVYCLIFSGQHRWNSGYCWFFPCCCC